MPLSGASAAPNISKSSFEDCFNLWQPYYVLLCYGTKCYVHAPDPLSAMHKAAYVNLVVSLPSGDSSLDIVSPLYSLIYYWSSIAWQNGGQTQPQGVS